MPFHTLYDIGYFVLHREYVRRIDTEEYRKARDRAQSRLDSTLTAAETDDESGLPAWVVQSGIQPADGGPLM